MDRPVGWPKELRRYAADLDGRPFVWADTDCGSVVRGAIAIVLGRDPFSFTYTTERGALRVWKRLGSAATALEEAGAVEVPSTFAMQGDVLVNDAGEGHVEELAIVVGSGILSSATESGVYWRSGIPRWRCFRMPGGSRVGVDG